MNNELIIQIYYLLKKHNKFIEMCTKNKFGYLDELSKMDRLQCILITVFEIEHVDILDILLLINTTKVLLENNTTEQFENDMFILMYCLSVGII
jgi:hypothetical protein